MEKVIGNTILRIMQGDITEQETDAIVNAANRSLMGGGGVDGAIHRKGGPSILEECRRIRSEEHPEGLPPGECVITGAGRLPAGSVIHTVGPIWKGGSHHEDITLEKCYTNSLGLSDEKGLHSISFPSISTGAYGYPMREACLVALKAVKAYLENNRTGINEIRLVMFSTMDEKVCTDASRSVFRD